MSRAAGLLFCLTLLGCGDPELTFNPGAAVLVVGQRVSIVVTQGGEGSDLVQNSFELVDAGGRTYGAQNGKLELKQISGQELQFDVPPGITPGEATLGVSTSKGLPFRGKVNVNRLIAMRDLSGKVWLLALTGGGSASQFAEAAAGTFGSGIGQVAIGYRGRLLAASARGSAELYLAWVDAQLAPSAPQAFDSSVRIYDLVVSPTGTTLIATSSGVYAAAAPTENPPAAPTLTEVTTTEATGLAVDRAGARAVAVLDPGTTGTVSLAFIDLTASPPVQLSTLATSWTGGAGDALKVALSPDGRRALVVDGSAGKVALFNEGQTSAVEQDMPAEEAGAVAAACAQNGTTFYIANGTSKNLSQLRTTSDAVSFDGPLDLSSADGSSGAPVGIEVSEAGEVVILLEHDLLLLADQASEARALTFSHLFKNKPSGEVGGAVALQP